MLSVVTCYVWAADIPLGRMCVLANHICCFLVVYGWTVWAGAGRAEKVQNFPFASFSYQLLQSLSSDSAKGITLW